MRMTREECDKHLPKPMTDAEWERLQQLVESIGKLIEKEYQPPNN